MMNNNKNTQIEKTAPKQSARMSKIKNAKNNDTNGIKNKALLIIFESTVLQLSDILLICSSRLFWR